MACTDEINRLRSEVQQLEECVQVAKAAHVLDDENITGAVRDVGSSGSAAATTLELFQQHCWRAAKSLTSFQAELKGAVQNQRQKQPQSGLNAADKYNKLDALVDIVKQGDVKLIKGDYLIKVFEKSTEPVKRHQDLPEEAFVPFEDLLKEDMDIVAISYCWCTREHPDPDRYHLPIIAKMAKATMAGKFVEAHISRPGPGSTSKAWDQGFRFGASAVAVLWDFLSLPQVDAEGKRTAAESAAFKRGLSSMNAWYGSRHVTKLILTDLPSGAARKSYDSSGWTFFEREVANIISPRWKMLTLARGNKAYQQLFEKDRFDDLDYFKIAYAAFQAGNRQGPMLPDQFDERLEELTFTNGKVDKAIVKEKYREAFSSLVQGSEEISSRIHDMTHQAAEEALRLMLADELDFAVNKAQHPGGQHALTQILGGANGSRGAVQPTGRRVIAPSLEALKTAVEQHSKLSWDPRLANLAGAEGEVRKDDPSDGTTNVFFPPPIGLCAWLPTDILKDVPSS